LSGPKPNLDSTFYAHFYAHDQKVQDLPSRYAHSCADH
jgi:hypothetical protein